MTDTDISTASSPSTPQSGQSSGFFRAFIDHPASVDETYLQHMGFAMRFAARLLYAGCGALIHALIPPLCETTASRQIKALYQVMEARKQAANK